MIGTQPLILRCITLALGVAISIDGGLYLYARASIDRIARHTDLMYRSPGEREIVPPPDGYTSSASMVSIPTAGSGWAIRYASKDCQFCRADEPQWKLLSTELQRRGYRVIVVVPDAKEEYSPDAPSLAGAQQEAYVNIAWIKQFRLSVTPTLLLFAPNQTLIWAHEGALGAADRDSALRAVR